jgi:hypothetical protein
VLYLYITFKQIEEKRCELIRMKKELEHIKSDCQFYGSTRHLPEVQVLKFVFSNLYIQYFFCLLCFVTQKNKKMKKEIQLQRTIIKVEVLQTMNAFFLLIIFFA